MKAGQIQAAPGVSEFEFSVTVTANSGLTGSESLSLELSQAVEVLADATASLDGLEECQPAPPEPGKCIDDVVLYLVLDNSTSMLQSDPSTSSASRSDRLEAQDRVALYAYQQAIEKAGYGFSRIGADDVLGAVAKQAACEDGLEVDVVAMGDDTDANFPAIYGDLFSDKTFDPSSGGWSYAVQDSYGLPEFDG